MSAFCSCYVCGIEMENDDWYAGDGVCSDCALLADRKPKKKKKDVEDKTVKKTSVRKPGIREEFRRLEESGEFF